MIVRPRPALLLALTASGCGAVCQGPQCESNWPATRVVVLDASALVGEVDPLEEAGPTWEGGADDGASWAIADAGGSLVMGQPEPGRVVQVAVVGTELVREATWDDGGDRFGASVAVAEIAGDPLGFELFVGAPAALFSSGSIFVFRDAGATGSLTSGEADLRIDGTSDGDLLGTRLEVCGDLTGDGLPEVLATSPWFASQEGTGIPGLDAVPALAGAVVLLESEKVGADLLATDPPERAPWELGSIYWGGAEGEGAGSAVSCGADLDGDGVVDLVVGAPWRDGARGRVYVISGGSRGGSSSLEAAASVVLSGREPGEWFGMAVATGELTGDGPAELIVGAAGRDLGRGAVYLFEGGRVAGQALGELLAEEGRANPDHLGRWLEAADLDGDRLDDLVVGAPDYKARTSGFDTGRAWLWYGDALVRLFAGGSLAARADGAQAVLVGRQPFQRVGRMPLGMAGTSGAPASLVLPMRKAAPR